MAERNPAGGVQSVERAFSLLELIANAGGTVALGELAGHSSLPLPTIHRLLRTLVNIGYLRQLPDRRYGLAPKFVQLGDVASKQFGVAARPTLMKLVDEFSETANMAVLDGDLALYVAQVPSKHNMRTFTEVGRRVHAHDSGVGKALLAELPDETVRGIVHRAGMPAPTPTSITNVDDLIVELERIRARGYALDEGEQEVGVRCVAVAVPGLATQTAISLSGPAIRLDADFIERAVPRLHAAADDIAAQMRMDAGEASP